MESRRHFLKLAAGLPALAAFAKPVARRDVVKRHNPELRDFNPRSPLSVGNGEFAFTVDATGLQTFPAMYEKGMPLGTQSQWGWQTSPGRPAGEVHLETFDTHGRNVGYATSPTDQRELFNWLRENPHRAQLGRIGFDIADVREIRDVHQILDLWSGTISSKFTLRGHTITVQTCCHPALDAIAVRVTGPADIRIDIPGKKETERPGLLVLQCDGYRAQVLHLGATLEGNVLRGESIELVCCFSPSAVEPPLLAETFEASREHWAAFWNGGAAMDFSAASNSASGGPSAHELERRVVLSQYLTAIQCAGSMPPQETGLVCNSWFGKFHLEMHWWHAAHFPLWGRAPLLERSLGYYARILPSARERARSQGYAGCRWPKMTDASGRDSPSPIGPLLIWQQPHPIAMAELCYRAHPDRATLDRYRDMVLESAEFMASFAWHDQAHDRYMLGPPVIPAQENHPPRETWNPTYELEYWRYGLDVAQTWRERLGLPRDAQWAAVRNKLSALPVKDGVYLAHENCPQTFTQRNKDHPSMLAALGVLPRDRVDPATMRRTFDKVIREWKFADTWGWDYPMMAMTAARLGEPQKAIDALFLASPKNEWLPNGHVYQRPGLPLYLPANGGLLIAMAVMAATKAFPWPVQWEGLMAPA